MIRGARRIVASLAALAVMTVAGQGCRRAEEAPMQDDVLLMMGDSALTMQDVVSRIPIGISPSDSAAIFHKIVSGWIGGMVLTDMAKAKLPDFEEIERQVDDYRNRLIVMSYLSMMRSSSNHKVSEDSVKRFYETHRKDMLAERPLVKGLLMKVPASASGLSEIKRCVFTASSQSLDELERNWATDALQYDYFEQTWVDWQTIAEQIPYRFFDPDAFVMSTKNFETTSGGSVYLLHISDYLPSGSELPFEFAAPRITAILEKAKMSKYEEDLVASLVKRALADDKLVAVGYDPVTGRLIKRGEDREKKNQRDEK